jgi:hypothetical protein
MSVFAHGAGHQPVRTVPTVILQIPSVMAGEATRQLDNVPNSAVFIEVYAPKLKI